jgi:hypothetical protein
LPTAIGDVGEDPHSGTLDAVNGWAVAAGVAVLALAGVRELVRWRGRRWQKSGPRGTD